MLTPAIHNTLLSNPPHGVDDMMSETPQTSRNLLDTSALFETLRCVFRNCRSVVLKKATMNLLFAINNATHDCSLKLVFGVYLFLVYANNQEEASVGQNRNLLKEAKKRFGEQREFYLVLCYAAMLNTQIQKRGGVGA